MAYAESTPELERIAGTQSAAEAALEVASGIVDSRALALYETPVDFDEIDASDAKTRDQARIEAWTLAVASYVATANRAGQSEQTVKQYEWAVADMDRVRAGLDVLASLTPKEAPIRARAF